MDMSFTETGHPRGADPHSGDLALWSQRVASSILTHAVLVGIAADALLRDGPGGAAFPLWIALGALAATSLVWCSGRRISPEVRAWLLTAVAFSLGLAWRNGGFLQLLDLGATFGALMMAAIALNNRHAALFAERLRDTLWTAAVVARNTLAGMLPLVLTDLGAPRAGARMTPRAWAALRAALIATVLLVGFGSLLREADPIFASLVSLPEIDLERLMSHLVFIGIVVWFAGGWARGALLAGPADRAPDTVPFQLGALDVTAALGALNFIFVLFMLSQLGWFFGGETFLRERTGLTAAMYARQGFFQMVGVVALVVPLLWMSRAALAPGRDLARRHTALALPIVALLFAILGSAFLRMRLYVHYYGLTVDRFYALAFMAWLVVVLGWLAATVLRDQGRPFVGGAVIAGVFTLAVLNLLPPDAAVARFDVARAATAPDSELDLPYLARLGGEAADVVVSATLAPSRRALGTPAREVEDERRCRAARLLLGRWGAWSPQRDRAEQDGAWRRWNAGAEQARQVVDRHASALRGVVHAACRRDTARRPSGS